MKYDLDISSRHCNLNCCALFNIFFKGDYAAARMYYQRALLLSPGSKLLKENLAKLDRLEKKLQGA